MQIEASEDELRPLGDGLRARVLRRRRRLVPSPNARGSRTRTAQHLDSAHDAAIWRTAAKRAKPFVMPCVCCRIADDLQELPVHDEMSLLLCNKAIYRSERYACFKAMIDFLRFTSRTASRKTTALRPNQYSYNFMSSASSNKINYDAAPVAQERAATQRKPSFWHAQHYGGRRAAGARALYCGAAQRGAHSCSNCAASDGFTPTTLLPRAFGEAKS
eukprot:6181110-Pleurochrysis_carterae.AAC.3